MIKVSFIIPFYKGEKTIHAMMDSIFSMQMDVESFEVVIVDDCSPVMAESVLRTYVEQYSNVRVFRHETNKRQGGAKNTGIRLARGLYIAFADQDDVVNPENMYSALDNAIRLDVDMLACHYHVLHEDGTVCENGITDGDGALMSGKEFCESYFQTGCNLVPWANLYKREFLLKVAHPYEENVMVEDSDWIAWHWIHANRIGIYNHSIYTWIINPSSITHSLHYVNRADWIRHGYRKIRDSHEYAPISSVFADVMCADGRNNISGGMKKAWKVDNYVKFYQRVSVELPAIQKMEWHGIIRFLINHSTMSVIALSIIGPILKSINKARSIFFK